MELDIKKKVISNNEINPQLLFIDAFSFYEKNLHSFPIRLTYFYELELYTGETDTIININNHKQHVRKGDVIFRRPGDFSKSQLPYSCFFLSFNPTKVDVGSKVIDAHKKFLLGDLEFGYIYENDFIDSIPLHTPASSSPEVFNLFRQVYQEKLIRSEDNNLLATANILKILCYLSNQSKACPLQESESIGDPILDSLLTYVNNNLEQNLSLDDLASYANVSKRHINNLFKKHLHVTPNNYIVQARLNLAKRLIIYTRDELTAISKKCGFNNYSYFANVFKKYCGMSPLQMRRKSL